MSTKALVKHCSSCDHTFAVRVRTAPVQSLLDLCPCCGGTAATVLTQSGTLTEAVGLARAVRRGAGTGVSEVAAAAA